MLVGTLRNMRPSFLIMGLFAFKATAPESPVIPMAGVPMRSTSTASKTFCAALILAGSAFIAPPVRATTGPLGVFRQFDRTASIDALGDSAFAAFLGWEAGEHHWNATLTGFAPTGYYSSTELAITGLHRPGLDLKAGYTFLGLQTGIEASAAVGVTVNAINTATDYQSGAELHVEGALNEHLPFGLAAGVGGYYYQQITPDGGSGNKIGAFRGRVAAIGPLLSYTLKAGAQEITLSGRWFHDFDVIHRVQGNAVFASLSFRL
jgi:hypothetical protein